MSIEWVFLDLRKTSHTQQYPFYDVQSYYGTIDLQVAMIASTLGYV